MLCCAEGGGMSEIRKLNLAELRDGLKVKKFSAVEVAKEYISACEKHRALNAFITETPEIALAQAKNSDEKIAAGKSGKLEGIPIAVKDLFCTKGVLTTASSHILDGFKPTYESTITTRMFSEGAVMLGKTALDEFAMGSTNLTSYYGAVKNPWKTKEGKEVVPGGSSGGSAAATAAHICAGSLGTDTGGSIRQPAAFTGTVGMKPTYGRCSRWGIVAFASSLDQAGPITRTVKDAAIMMDVIAGFDEKDSTSANIPTPGWEKNINQNMKGKKIGIPKEYNADGMPSEIKSFWEKGAEWLKKQGAEIIDINLPHTKYALPAYYIVAPAEASSNLARYDGVRYGLRTKQAVESLDDLYEKTRAEGFGREVKRRILIGTYVLSHGYYDAYYKQAQKVRTLVGRDFKNAFEEVDAILTPTTPSPAFGIGDKMSPVEIYLNDIFTVTANIGGICGMSVPVGLSTNGLPLGLQILGKPFDEQTVFDVGAAIENAANFTARPEGF